MFCEHTGSKQVICSSYNVHVGFDICFYYSFFFLIYIRLVRTGVCVCMSLNNWSVIKYSIQCVVIYNPLRNKNKARSAETIKNVNSVKKIKVNDKKGIPQVYFSSFIFNWVQRMRLATCTLLKVWTTLRALTLETCLWVIGIFWKVNILRWRDWWPE